MEASRAAGGHLDLQRMGGEGFRLCHPLLPFKMLLNTPLGLVSIIFGVKGSNFILYPDGAQGGTCVEAAARAIRAGRLAGALVGGTSCGLSFLPVCTLRRLGRLASDPRSATPYRPGHAGYAPADAAAFVVLESLAAARARGARPRAVLEGVAVGRTPTTERALRWRPRGATWSALCAGRRPEVLVTGGTVDQADDRAALEAVQAAWPGETLPVTSPDGGLGYTGAASFLVNLSLGARMAEEDRATPLHGEEASLLSDRWPAEAQNLARGTGGNRVLICTTDPDGGHAAAVLRRPED
jgi:3-oxoacyl-(acyl-carrier-protein) synthase